MAFLKQTLTSVAIVAMCSALLVSCAPTNGKTSSKTSNSNNLSPLASIRQQQATKSSSNAAPIFSPRPPTTTQAPIVQQQQQQEPEVDADTPQQQIQQQPQQQQQQEVDPNVAAQDSQPALIAPGNNAPAIAAPAEEAEPKPEPYAFNYAWESGDGATAGASSRSEQQDASGLVTGFYTLRGDDGRNRRVDYTADASGFRAIVSTNELGTEPKDPADVQMRASPASEGQLRAAALATELARQRAALNPQPLFVPQAQPQPIFIIGQEPNQAPLASSASGPQQQIQQANLGLASGNQATVALAPNFGQRKGASKNPPRERFASASKQVPVLAAASSQQDISQQLQEPFEQIRQSELKARSVRQAPFYLFSN